MRLAVCDGDLERSEVTTVGHAHNSWFAELGVGEGEANELVLTEGLRNLVFDGSEARLLRDEIHVEIAEVFF